MASESESAVVVNWAGLPWRVLALISSKLGGEIRLRSVCQSWRSRTPRRSLHKLLYFFPMRSLLFPNDNNFEVAIKATAVYFVRPLSDRNKAWLVSAQESSPGKLILFHGLTYQEIEIEIENTKSAYTTKRVAISYHAHNEACIDCNRLVGMSKVVFLGKSASTHMGLVGSCQVKGNQMFAFRVDLTRKRGLDSRQRITSTAAMPLLVEQGKGCGEIVSHEFFKGRMFAVDRQGRIFVLVPEKLELVEIRILGEADADRAKKHLHLVVSPDGGSLLLVSTNFEEKDCRIYQLFTDECTLRWIIAERSHHLVMQELGYLGEDAVFLIGKSSSFSVRPRLLPPPWKGIQGTSVVYVAGNSPPTTSTNSRRPVCGCRRHVAARQEECSETMIVHLPHPDRGEESQFYKISDLQGYSDLFSPSLDVLSA